MHATNSLMGKDLLVFNTDARRGSGHFLHLSDKSRPPDDKVVLGSREPLNDGRTTLRVVPSDDGLCRLYFPAEGRYMFCSYDEIQDGDDHRIVEAKTDPSDARCRFAIKAQESGSASLYCIHTETYVRVYSHEISHELSVIHRQEQKEKDAAPFLFLEQATGSVATFAGRPLYLFGTDPEGGRSRFLFVSHRSKDGDRIVEAHHAPWTDGRSNLVLDDAGDGTWRVRCPAYDHRYFFCSYDEGRYVEARAEADPRNRFYIREVAPGQYTLMCPATNTFVQISRRDDGEDSYVVHGEAPYLFRILLPAAPNFGTAD